MTYRPITFTMKHRFANARMRKVTNEEYMEAAAEHEPLLEVIKENQNSHEHCIYCIKAMSNPDPNFCCLCWVRNG